MDCLRRELDVLKLVLSEDAELLQWCCYFEWPYPYGNLTKSHDPGIDVWPSVYTLFVSIKLSITTTDDCSALCMLCLG